jgi:hypothetical protein
MFYLSAEILWYLSTFVFISEVVKMPCNESVVFEFALATNHGVRHTQIIHMDTF